MSSTDILISNAIVYTLTLIIYLIINKTFNTGVLLLSLYTFAAWSSCLFYNHPLFHYSIHNSKMTIEPFIYLYLVLMLFLYSFLKFKSNKIRSIRHPNPAKFIPVVKFLVIVQCIDILMQIPSLIDLSSHLDWNETRNIIYENETWFWFQHNSILSHLHLFVGGMFPLSMALSFYAFFVYPYKNKGWNTMFFLTTLLVRTINQILISGRGLLLLTAIYIFFLFLLFYNHLTVKDRKKLRNAFIIMTIPLALFFITVSQSRFTPELVSFYNYKYAGESFINFNGLMYNNLKGTTDGEAYFTLFTRIFHPEQVKFNVDHDKWDFIKSKTKVSGQYFYTFIGALCFEFGLIGTFLIALFLALLSHNILRKNKQITINQILFYSIGGYLFINGVFLFILQGSAGNTTLVLLILFMIYFTNGNTNKIINSPKS